MSTIVAGAVGLTIQRTAVDENGTVIDLSGASSVEFVFRRVGRPDIRTTLTCSFATDGSDGVVQANTTALTLPSHGTWQGWVHFVSATQDLYSEPWSFIVSEAP